MNRRRALVWLGGAGLAALGYRYWPDQGWVNPCLAALPPRTLLDHPRLRPVWEGLDPKQLWDCHVHVAGVGDGGSGIWHTPRMDSPRHPLEMVQKAFYLNASCSSDDHAVDSRFVERLVAMHQAFPAGARFMLMAFDYYYDSDGRRRPDRSTFHVPNEYVAALARQYPQRFEWIASIHPYRADALAALEWAARNGARAVKWLPPAMGMDPSVPRCDAFYQALVRHRLPLMTHAGEELAVRGGDAQALGNPLHLRRPLDQGVRVLVAHCASLGRGVDLDRGPDAPQVDNFALFARLMDEPRYIGLLFGEISALTQLNRLGDALDTVVRRRDWHARLVNGSDYPLPGVMPLFSLTAMVRRGYIDTEEAALLSALRRHNVLLFDLALKRLAQVDGARLPSGVFHTRRLFEAG